MAPAPLRDRLNRVKSSAREISRDFQIFLLYAFGQYARNLNCSDHRRKITKKARSLSVIR
jgi:hypothetical protein